MRTMLWLLPSICFGVVAFASAADLNVQNPPTITLNREVHFTSDEGTDIAVAPDSYAIGPGSESRSVIELRKGTDTITLPAAVTSHQEQVSSHVALLISDDPDSLHIVLLLPGGKAFDAIGYFSVARPRDVQSRIPSSSRINAALIQQEANKVGPSIGGSAVTSNPAILAELQRRTAEEEKAKKELEPQALLARIRVLESLLSCMGLWSYTGSRPYLGPGGGVGFSEVRWDGHRCP